MQACIRVAAVVAALGCQESPPQAAPRFDTVAFVAPRHPVGFVGRWLRVAPREFRGDTLDLRADTTTAGRIPLPRRGLVAVNSWHIHYLSKDAVGARRDHRQGYSDGGEMDCFKAILPECVSLPNLCFRFEAGSACQAFVISRDSLLLVDGQRFVRLNRTEPASPPRN